jgi:hypothetical protein
MVNFTDAGPLGLKELNLFWPYLGQEVVTRFSPFLRLCPFHLGAGFHPRKLQSLERIQRESIAKLTPYLINFAYPLLLDRRRLVGDFLDSE